MESEAKHQQHYLLAAILAVTAAVYLATLQFGFVSDDVSLILNNPVIKDWHAAPYYFTHHMWAHQIPWTAYYRPIYMLLFRLEYASFGTNPVAWHAVNLLLHLTATALVYRLACQLLKGDYAPLMAAVLFGLHPSHVEVVSWIAANGDSLLTVFVLASMICYVRARYEIALSRRWMAWSVMFYALAVFTKEPGIFVPAFLLAYEFFLHPRDHEIDETKFTRLGKVARPLTPFAIVAVVYLVVRMNVLGAMSHDALPFPPQVVAQTWPWLLWFYVQHLMWPTESSMFFNNPYVMERHWLDFWMPICCLFTIAAFLFWCWQRNRSGMFPFALCCTLLPLAATFNINMFQIHDYAHDRFLYMPSVFFCLWMAELLRSVLPLPIILEGALRRWQAAILGTLVLAMAVQCIKLMPVWVDERTLYLHGVAVSGEHSALAYSNLGWMHYRNADYENAALAWQQSVKQYPNWWEMHKNLGNAYFRMNRIDLALQEFGTASQIAGKTVSPDAAEGTPR